MRFYEYIISYYIILYYIIICYIILYYIIIYYIILYYIICVYTCLIIYIYILHTCMFDGLCQSFKPVWCSILSKDALDWQLGRVETTNQIPGY